MEGAAVCCGILLGWALAFMAIAGLGTLALKLFAVSAGTTDFADAFWVGFSVLLSALAALHLFFPVHAVSVLPLVLLGLVGFGLRIRTSLGQPQRGWIIVGLFMVLPVLVAAHRATRSPEMIDCGLYYLNTIRWYNEHPVVPGLGNLHVRLASNNTSLLYAAAFNLTPSWVEGIRLANPLLLLVLLWQVTTNAFGLFSSGGGMSHHRILSLVLVPLLTLRLTIDSLSSPAADFVVFVLQIVIFLYFLRLFELDPAANDKQAVFVLLVVLTVAVSLVKLSSAAFSAVFLSLSILLYCRGSTGASSKLVPALRRTLLVGFLLAVPWLIHGAMLSGWLLYPLPFFSLPVDWKVPEPLVREEADWIRTFAREKEARARHAPSEAPWLAPWFTRMRQTADFTRPLVVFGGASLGLSLILVVKRSKRLLALYAFLVIPLLAALGFWFWAAPALRFAGALFWILGLSVLSVFLASVPYRRQAVMTVIGVLIGVFSLYELTRTLASQPRDHWFHFEPVQVAQLDVFYTRSGLGVYVPKDLGRDYQVWDSPLPATPYPDPNLCLRGAGLGSGFLLRAESRGPEERDPSEAGPAGGASPREVSEGRAARPVPSAETR
jgi:hypothetical protein